MTLTVIRAGALSTVQDLGRWGFQHLGVPVSGAMDSFAHRMANALVGNPDTAATIEMTMVGPELRVNAPMTVCVTGADVEINTSTGRLNGWQSYALSAGTTLRLRRMRRGCRAYLAVAGGIGVRPVMGSRSTFVKSALGGIDGRTLRAGDVVPVSGTAFAPQTTLTGIRQQVSPFALEDIYSARPVRVVPSRYLHEFGPDAQQAFWNGRFTLSMHSDRMGYRLNGPSVFPPAGFNRPSEGAAFGTIQVTPQGQLIILMADRQTTGGYPTIGTIVSADHPLLAQLVPGSPLQFACSNAMDGYAALCAMNIFVARVRIALDRK